MKQIGHPSHKQIYRSRDGLILGVLQGVAEHYDLSVFWLRMFTLLLFIFSGIWPMTFIYLIAGVLMKPAPPAPLANDEEKEFYDNYLTSPKSAANRLKRRYESLERRIQRIEDIVTSREFDFERRLESDSRTEPPSRPDSPND